ncbi:hypothetical protein X801_01672 [Opisthorchis viverrini]|uniref:Uncharacterized protein n=1 Tax=Opisthorchis viverrini TaxID=6198 RepID=A0A1S8X7M6_OPIVI|nr:hypothetical protein X801_01672 [Opisthorchis viverrini]
MVLRGAFRAIRRNFYTFLAPTFVAYIIYKDYSRTQREKMGLPEWALHNWKGRVASFVLGGAIALAGIQIIQYAFPYTNTKLKNKSALYGGRAVPEGSDPWEY